MKEETYDDRQSVSVAVYLQVHDLIHSALQMLVRKEVLSEGLEHQTQTTCLHQDTMTCSCKFVLLMVVEHCYVNCLDYYKTSLSVIIYNTYL